MRRKKRLTRAALFFAGAVGASACGNGAEEPRDDPAQGSEVEEDPGMNDIYGGPPIDEEEEPPPAEESEESMPVEAYGAPPPPLEE